MFWDFQNVVCRFCNFRIDWDIKSIKYNHGWSNLKYLLLFIWYKEGGFLPILKGLQCIYIFFWQQLTLRKSNTNCKSRVQSLTYSMTPHPENYMKPWLWYIHSIIYPWLNPSLECASASILFFQLIYDLYIASFFHASLFPSNFEEHNTKLFWKSSFL